MNTLKVPDHLPDEKVLFLSDIMPTGWNAADMGNVSKGDRRAHAQYGLSGAPLYAASSSCITHQPLKP